jgi:hypothetical protein
MITQIELKQVLDYDPITGLFTWKIANSRRVKVGAVAGCLKVHGYISIDINNKRYYAHRLAFLYMTGKFPENKIDHINIIRNDNRWENLREANNNQNAHNSSRPSHNTSGFKGVSKNKATGRYEAHIKINNKKKFLGLYDTVEEAFNQRNRAALNLHKEFARSE